MRSQRTIFLTLFLISSTLFVLKAWRKDRSVAGFALLLLAIRSLALGLGFACGVLRPLLRLDG
jgi:hypothetical protein